MIQSVDAHEETNSYVLKPYFRLMVLGKSNTGKTHTAVSMIKAFYMDEYDRIIVIAPNYKQDHAIKRLKKICMQHRPHPKTINFTEDYDDETLDAIDEKIKTEAELGIKTLLIIDDPVGVGELTVATNKKSVFNRFVSGIKFRKCSLVFITQLYNASSTTLRQNLDGVIVMSNIPYKQLQNVHEDFGLDTFGKFKKQYQELTRKRGARFVYYFVQFGHNEIYYEEDRRLKRLVE